MQRRGEYQHLRELDVQKHGTEDAMCIYEGFMEGNRVSCVSESVESIVES
jgi:hypothetical protein